MKKIKKDMIAGGPPEDIGEARKYKMDEDLAD